MIIRLAEDGAAAIVEPLNLKQFHIEAHGLGGGALEGALAKFSSFESPDHA